MLQTDLVTCEGSCDMTPLTTGGLDQSLLLTPSIQFLSCLLGDGGRTDNINRRVNCPVVIRSYVLTTGRQIMPYVLLGSQYCEGISESQLLSYFHLCFARTGQFCGIQKGRNQRRPFADKRN